MKLEGRRTEMFLYYTIILFKLWRQSLGHEFLSVSRIPTLHFQLCWYRPVFSYQRLTVLALSACISQATCSALLVSYKHTVFLFLVDLGYQPQFLLRGT